MYSYPLNLLTCYNLHCISLEFYEINQHKVVLDYEVKGKPIFFPNVFYFVKPKNYVLNHLRYDPPCFAHVNSQSILKGSLNSHFWQKLLFINMFWSIVALISDCSGHMSCGKVNLHPSLKFFLLRFALYLAPSISPDLFLYWTEMSQQHDACLSVLKWRIYRWNLKNEYIMQKLIYFMNSI